MSNVIRTIRSTNAEAGVSLHKRRNWYAEGDGSTTTTTDTAPDKGGDKSGGAADKTFTQAELDRIINERLGRAKDTTTKELLAKYEVPDEDTLANLLKASKEAQEAKLSEVEKATKARESAETKAKQLEDALNAERQARRTDMLHNAVTLAAKDARARDAGDVLLWLQANHAGELAEAISEDNKLNAKAIAGLIGKAKEAKPYYFEGGRAGAGPGSPSNSGGGTPSPTEEARKRAAQMNKRLIRG